MRKTNGLNTYLRSFISLIILVVFAYMAFSYFGGTSQQKRKLPDGRWEMARYLGNGKSSVTTGFVGENGLFQGNVIVQHELDMELKSTEEVFMENGLRQGTAKLTYASGNVVYWCFEDDVAVHKGKCEEKSSSVKTLDSTAFGIFSNRVPWFAFTLDAFGFDEEYQQAYLDTLELLLYKNEITEENFDDSYDDVIDELSQTPYDSLISLNSILSIYNGLDLLKRHEFRLATFDAYLRGDSNTYQAIKTMYPNYLLQLSKYLVTDEDFKGFCHEYDSVMAGYSYVSVSDTFIIDTLDYRIYSTLNTISSNDETSSSTFNLKAAELNLKNELLTQKKTDYFLLLRNYIKESSPTEVSSIIMATMLIQLAKGDCVRKAVYRSFLNKKGIATIPITSIRIENLTSSTCLLRGNVIDNGGAEVIKRGITWSTYYNPANEGNLEYAGSGTGVFEATLNGLNPEKTYYARAFATNSAGTYYGNCIRFKTSATNIDENLDVEKMFRLYPNPASSHITIEIQSKISTEYRISIINELGQVVFLKKYSKIQPGIIQKQVDVSGFPSGTYSCILLNNKQDKLVQKFLIMK